MLRQAHSGLFIFLASLALTVACPAASAATPQDKKPNVLLVVIDDLNDYVSLLANHPGVKTPNLDKFARSGMVFTRSYCAAPICNPSRTALLSGIAPYRSGVYENDDPMQASTPVMNSVLLPEQFQRHGYHTMWNGKIFHTGPGKARSEKMWHDREGGQGRYGPMPTQDPIGKEIKRPPMFTYQPWTGPDSDFCDLTNLEINLQRLERTYDKPFFLAYGIYRPHNPWTAPKRFFDLHPLDSIVVPTVPEDDLRDLPPLALAYAKFGADYQQLRKTEHWKRVVQAYLASISFMDDTLGRLLAALDRSPHRDNTIVCIVADNGFHLGEKEHFAKFALWEQTTRVLHLWRVPGLTPPGTRCAATVSLLDVYPTLNALCGLSPTPQTLDGRSLVPLLQDPQGAWNRPALTTYRQNDHAIRTDRWRYIRYHDGTEELYDHQNDPKEWTNLADRPESQTVKKALAAALPQTNVVRVGPGKKGQGGETD